MKDKKTNIPTDIKDSLDLYLNEGYHPGSFLLAVLSNNLFHAVKCAAHKDLTWIAIYIINNFPSDAYGSKETIYAWINKKREERESKKENHEQEA